MTNDTARRRRVLWALAMVTLWLLVAVGAVLAASSIWVRRTFGVISIDQLMMNLPGGGAPGAGGSDIVVHGVLAGIVLPLTCVLIAVACVEAGRRWLRRRHKPGPRGSRWMRAVSITTACAVLVAGSVSLSAVIGVRDYVDSYVREAVTGTTLSDFYVAPPLTGDGATATATSKAVSDSATAATPETARNLIVIYLESIEDAFADDSLFEENMLAPVQRATQGWATIPSLTQYEGGGWTMAGLVSTMCGIPLRSAGANANPTDLNAIGSAPEGYLPGAVCLGDVLADRGYRNVFLGGADANFAGKGSFLSGHGFDDVRDLQTWQAAGETELNPAWGLSDRRLFELAADTVTELHDAGEPFNLTMLSLDTHELPYAHDYCNVDTDAEMTAITLCSMQQVAGFIEYLSEQGYLDDTAVMVMGDHDKFIAEGNSFGDELGALETHTIFNRMWVPPGVDLEVAREETDQLGMYATLLELAGATAPDHRAGVGVSAFATEVPTGSMLELAPDAYRDVVTSRSSAFYRDLWDTAEQAPDSPNNVVAGSE